VDFVLIAFCLFLVVKFMNSLKKKEEEVPAPAPAPVKSDETVLLEEIRDLLKNK
jgi:large conductance mechanosensitive channel